MSFWTWSLNKKEVTFPIIDNTCDHTRVKIHYQKWLCFVNLGIIFILRIEGRRKFHDGWEKKFCVKEHTNTRQAWSINNNIDHNILRNFKDIITCGSMYFFSAKLKLFVSFYGNSCAHMLMLYMEGMYKEATILYAALKFF